MCLIYTETQIILVSNTKILDYSWSLYYTESRSSKFTILPYAELYNILHF
jgi:hypothetical protein